MARFTTLYSGSSGNAGVAEEDGAFLLVDMGASCRATVAAMAQAGLEPEKLCGILVTHEHIDHIRGLRVFLKKYPVPVFGSAAMLEELWRIEAVPPATQLVAVDGRSEKVGGFTVRAFPTSHDSVGCCGFRIEMPSGRRMAIATDLGVVDEEVYANLSRAHLVALEANYDIDMLRLGPYPGYLKRRIDSARGHLSNRDSAAVVAALVGEGCGRISLCHLSSENNRPQLALDEMYRAMLENGVRLPEDGVLQVARRYEVSDWIEFD